jgi:hypothetical protein
MDAFRMIEASSGKSGSAFCAVNRRHQCLSQVLRSILRSPAETKAALKKFFGS